MQLPTLPLFTLAALLAATCCAAAAGQAPTGAWHAQGAGFLTVCTAPWPPLVACTPGGFPSNFSGFDVEMFRAAATRLQLEEGRDWEFEVRQGLASCCCSSAPLETVLPRQWEVHLERGCADVN